MLHIIAYHRIAEFGKHSTVDDRSISATPLTFREQMRHVAQHYRCVSLPEVLDAVERNLRLPKRSVLISFDDAYGDFAEVAWPILREFRLSATMFVPTAFPGDAERVFWWDKLYRAFSGTVRMRLADSPIGPLSLATWEERQRGLRALQNYLTRVANDDAIKLADWSCEQLVEAPIQGGAVLSWDALRNLAKDGLTLGSHTQTHAVLTQLPASRIREEIRSSQQDLKREIGVVWPIFCYPNGNHNDTTGRILQEEGIKLAFTTIPGRNDLSVANRLRLGRTCITPRSSIAIFRARLLPLGVQLDAWRHHKLKAVLTRTFPQAHAAND